MISRGFYFYIGCKAVYHSTGNLKSLFNQQICVTVIHHKGNSESFYFHKIIYLQEQD